MNDHSSRRSGAPWPAEDQPTSRRQARSRQTGRRSRPNLGLLAGPAALLVVGAGLAATGISRAADTPAPKDVVVPAAARGGQARAAAPNQNNGGNKNGAKNQAKAPAAAAAAAAATTTTTTVAGAGQAAAGAAGPGTIALPGNTAPNGGAPGAKMRIRHRGQAAPPCSLIVPQNPLTKKGLETPYELVLPCHEATKDQAVFVQAAIIDRDGKIELYNPLVIDQGTKPAADPAPATVPAGSIVGIWFGANGDAMTLASSNPDRRVRANGGRLPFGGGNSLTQGKCVNGLPGSIFGQYGYCNAPQFFSAAHRAIARGQLQVPATVGVDEKGNPVPGKPALDGKPCPTVRDFMVVDQDQSDNVNTHYRVTADGRTAQPYAAAKLEGSTDLANGSDNRLDTDFIKPALGCSTFMAPDQSNNREMTASQPLQELEAALHQDAPVALVPLNNPMTLLNDKQSVRKTNLYRAGVDQPLIWGRFGGNNRAANAKTAAPADAAPADATATAAEAANLVEKDANVAAPDAAPVADVQAQDARSRFRDNGSPLAYCQGMYQNPRGVARVFTTDNKERFAKFKSANADDADSLFTFLALRAQSAFDILGCGDILKIDNPIAVTPKEGKVTDATFTPTGAIAGAATPTTTTPVDPALVVPAPVDQLMNAQPPVVQAPADAPAPAAAPAAPAADPAPPAAPAPVAPAAGANGAPQAP
jgi:hypothetical protein